nr:hypothetical protein [Bacillus cereus]
MWTKQIALEALKWTIEVKKQMDKEEIRKKVSVNWFTQIGLSTPLERYWNHSPFSMINELYPGCFNEWEFQMTPRNYWTKKRVLEALKWTIEEKEQLTTEQLVKLFSRKWIINQGLRTPLDQFWSSNPHAMLSELYPNKLFK